MPLDYMVNNEPANTLLLQVLNKVYYLTSYTKCERKRKEKVDASGIWACDLLDDLLGSQLGRLNSFDD